MTFESWEDQRISDLINQNIASAQEVEVGVGGDKRPIEGHSRSCRPAQVEVMEGRGERPDFNDRSRSTC